MVKIIKNGRVIDPESRFDGRADLWIENGKIQKIVKKDTKAELEKKSKRLEQLEQEKKQLEKHFLGRFVLEKYNK